MNPNLVPSFVPQGIALRKPQPLHTPRACPEVDRFMSDNRALFAHEARLLQDEHNVNLHGSGEGDDFLDGEDDPLAGLTIITDEEFIERFVLNEVD